jgi:hypothetical protein
MTYLYVKPITWTQSIRRYQTIGVNGRYLTTQCRTDSDLILSDKLKLRDLEINLSFLRGALPDKDREKGKLSEGAIGGIWWVSEDNFVHGWFYLPAEDYDAIWEQIKRGDYIACDISLGTASDAVKLQAANLLGRVILFPSTAHRSLSNARQLGRTKRKTANLNQLKNGLLLAVIVIGPQFSS